VFVSALYGDNDTGTRNNPNRPYSSIQIATDAAIPGDTVVVVDGTFEEGLTNRQNVAYYFYMGTVVTQPFRLDSEAIFAIDNTITNVTIKGYGKFVSPRKFIIVSYSTNICTLTLEADLCDGGFASCFLTADIRVNTVSNGFYDVNITAIPGAEDPAYQVYPLSQPTVSWYSPIRLFSRKAVDYHNVNYTNNGYYNIGPQGLMRFYGGIYSSEADVYPNIEFNDTVVIYTFETDNAINNFTGNFIIK